MEPYPTPFSGAARAANYVEQDTPPLSAPDPDPDDVELDVDAEPVAPDVGADAEVVQWSTDGEPVPPPAAPPAAALGHEISQDLAGSWFASGITNGQEHARAARAQTGVRGVAAKFGLPVAPSRREVREARDAQLLAEAETCVRQSTWPRAIGVLVANRKGGTGKALEVHEPVVTPNGYQPIGSLTVGDLVMGRDGAAHVVLGVHPQGERELFKVVFTDGTVILADAEHLWEVEETNDRSSTLGTCGAPECSRPTKARGLCLTHYKQRRAGRPLTPPRVGNYGHVERTARGGRVMSTAQLIEAGLSVDRGARGKRHRWFVPVTDPVEFSHRDVPLDPYLLGLLIGDAYLNDPLEFTTADLELADAVRETVPSGSGIQRHGPYGYRLLRGERHTQYEVRDALQKLGLFGSTSTHKFVPGAYKFGTISTRTAVLQGLMDTDGCVAANGVAGEFTTVSAALADDVQFIAESLGCVVTRGAKTPSYTHLGERRTGQLAHVLRIKTPVGFELFRLERKRSKMRQGQRTAYRAIKSIEPAGRGEAVCIEVSAPDSLFLTRSFVPTHNTPVALCLAGTLATIRGGGVAVLEVSDDPGMLSLRAEGAPRVGLGELMRDAAQISSAGQLAAYTALQTSHAAVIGSVRPRPNLDGTTIVAIAKLIDTHYSIRVMDSGNVYTSGAFGAAVHTADVLVIPIADAADSVQDALALVGHLSGYPEGQRLLSSAVILRLRYIGATREIEARTDEAIAAMGVRRVVDVPEDPHIAERGEISLSKLHPRTRNAFLLAAASVVSEVRI